MYGELNNLTQRLMQTALHHTHMLLLLRSIKIMNLSQDPQQRLRHGVQVQPSRTLHL